MYSCSDPLVMLAKLNGDGGGLPFLDHLYNDGNQHHSEHTGASSRSSRHVELSF